MFVSPNVHWFQCFGFFDFVKEAKMHLYLYIVHNMFQRKVHEDHILPMNIKKHSHTNPDLNTTYDHRHKPKLHTKYENAFKEFVRRGKEMIFDELISTTYCNNNWIKNIKYLTNNSVPTEDKFEILIDNVLTEKEIETHLYQCWRYNSVYKEEKQENANNFEVSDNNVLVSFNKSYQSNSDNSWYFSPLSNYQRHLVLASDLNV